MPTLPAPSGLAAPPDRLSALLDSFEPDSRSPHPRPVQQAIQLARVLQQRAAVLQTAAERQQQDELERIMQRPHDKATLVQITDQALRSGNPARAADQLIHILDVQGIPRFFTALDKALLQGFRSFGAYLPGVTMPLVRDKLRAETANVILPAEEEHLLAHLRERQATGLRMNLNLLGEALLGEQAVAARLQRYLEVLQLPEVECVSVKISTIYSQINTLAWHETVITLSDRLEQLYREAARLRFRRPDGTEGPKFVYLDMEAYHDMHITADAFMAALDRPGLERVSAGIALQAYLPDAFAVQQRISRWARWRVEHGGAPVTIRLVKGANMEMERLDAALHGWPQAPFQRKAETDANYKRMLHFGLESRNIAAVRLGVASHNLFDLSYALGLGQQAGVLDRLQFEMLEGMANHQRRALAEVTDNLLLYAPATTREQFVHAIGYLVRRLDENTGPDNFLAHAFKLTVDSPEWERLAAQFAASFALLADLPEQPRRTQDRRKPAPRPENDDLSLAGFRNEPDTDWALPANVAWARAIVADWQPRIGEQAADIPLVIAGREIRGGREIRDCVDPSRPDTIVGHYREANQHDLSRAVACARADTVGWRVMAPEDRAAILGDCAQVLRERRAGLLGAAMADGGKTFAESDPEVSEAIDFVELYRRSALAFQRLPGIGAKPKGVVAVVPPWNFPIAIPAGGIAAALAAGNCVILKPASDTVLVAWELVQCFWAGGVPREVLQFMPCAGGGVGAQLAAHPEIDAVVLTGGTGTARRMLAARPDMQLLAETGGKDATIVTAMADRDQAIKHVLHSAFSHSGQKCSATSLLILEQEVYEDPHFRAALCDAVRSLPVGPAWNPRTRVGPLIRPPSGVLAEGIETLEPGEEWAVQPEQDPDNPRLWSPGVKWGVQPGNFTHMTELFGPVLGVMRADDLDHAIDLVNQTGYGLTSGIESLDEREQLHWLERIRAGNLYINRVTTGAVVLRQPFGGMGKSAFGPGVKAGGPNYVGQLLDFSEAGSASTPTEPTNGAADAERTGDSSQPDDVSGLLPAGSERLRPGGPSGDAASVSEGGTTDPLIAGLLRVSETARSAEPGDRARLSAALVSFRRAIDTEFGRTHDHVRLIGQDNLRRYLPVGALCIRLHTHDSVFDCAARLLAARLLGCGAGVSIPLGVAGPGFDWLHELLLQAADAPPLVVEDDGMLAERILAGEIERLRYAAPDRVPRAIHDAAMQTQAYIARAPVLTEGRVELLWYLREQSISRDYHRYGNLGERGMEQRAAVR